MNIFQWPGSRTMRAVQVAALLLAVACTPMLNWREVRPEGTRVVVLLPCKPDEQQRDLPLGGMRVGVRLLSCRAQGTSWALTIVQGEDPQRAQALARALRAARRAVLRGEERRAQAARVSGPAGSMPAWRLEVDGTQPNGEAVVEQSLLWVRGSLVFQLAALGGHPSEEALQMLFGGVQLQR